jgi:hypothetical protein
MNHERLLAALNYSSRNGLLDGEAYDLARVERLVRASGLIPVNDPTSQMEFGR